MIAFFASQENWKRYRCAAERLKSEAFIYCEHTGQYQITDKCKSKDIDGIFINNMEAIASNENAAWNKQRTDAFEKPIGQ